MPLLGKLESLNSLKDKSLIPDTIKGILFDMDGTLLHTEPLHALAISKVLPSFDFPLLYNENSFADGEALHEFFRGQSDIVVFKVFKEIFGDNWRESEESFIEKKNDFLDKNVSDQQLSQCMAGEMFSFLNDLKETDIKMALVSASQKPVVTSFSNKLDLERWFEFTMGAEDTEKTKPDPMPYIEAMKRLGINPKETLIFEDSESGLKSALASQAFVYQVSWY